MATTQHLPIQLERGGYHEARWGIVDIENRMLRAETVGIERAETIARALDDPGAPTRCALAEERLERAIDALVEFSRRAQRTRLTSGHDAIDARLREMAYDAKRLADELLADGATEVPS